MTYCRIFALALLLVPLFGCAPGASPSTSENPIVTLTTELGDIVIEVDQARAPISAGSFLAYVDSGAYVDGAFYRTVSPENDNGEPTISVIQGGIVDASKALEPVQHETTQTTGIHHEDGVVSLARTDPGTASGAAFFICIGDQPSLDYGGKRNPDELGFAAFGRVIRGMDVVHAIHRQDSTGASESPYTEGQILAKPIRIVSASRQSDDR